MIQTDLQKRNSQLQDIILMADLDGDKNKTIRTQLESMSFMCIDVVHQIVTSMSVSSREDADDRVSFERK
jgi:hypothetical protein